MADVSKQSIRIEIDPNEYENTQAAFEEVFFEAVDRMVAEEEEVDFLTSQFFTMRFDRVGKNIAATVTSSEKKG